LQGKEVIHFLYYTVANSNMVAKIMANSLSNEVLLYFRMY
jgi:hypothetical protein